MKSIYSIMIFLDFSCWLESSENFVQSPVRHTTPIGEFSFD